jgi:dihydrofolate synthase/folylpolyglutamate synthase
MTSPASISSQSCTNLHDWLSYIEQSHPIDKIELGLGRVQLVASRADLANLPGKKILIAGTNGKGTTARTLEQLLLAQGLTVAVYTSPHLLKFNERLRINSQDVTDELWVQGLQTVEQHRQETALTYFEFTTLAAFAIMKFAEVDVCIVEVGLGGRLDATNIIAPDACVITTIDLDHQDWLGNDRETIGREKAGIFRAHVPAIIGDLTVPASVLDVAAGLGSQVSLVGRDFAYTEQGQSWLWHHTIQHNSEPQASVQMTELPLPLVPVQNVATSLATLSALGLLPSRERVVKVLGEMTLPGRMQWLSKAPGILLDVAHNPQSAAYLAQQIAKLAPKYRRVTALIGMLKDKDITQSLLAFAPTIQHWHCVSLPGVRGASAEQVQQALPLQANSTLYADVGTAWRAVQGSLAADELLVIFGSFVTVSAVLELWHQETL